CAPQADPPRSAGQSVQTAPDAGSIAVVGKRAERIPDGAETHLLTAISEYPCMDLVGGHGVLSLGEDSQDAILQTATTTGSTDRLDRLLLVLLLGPETEAQHLEGGGVVAGLVRGASRGVRCGLQTRGLARPVQREDFGIQAGGGRDAADAPVPHHRGRVRRGQQVAGALGAGGVVVLW